MLLNNCYSNKVFSKQNGSALVELAAIFPFFLAIIFLVIEYSYWNREAMSVAFMSREFVNAGVRNCMDEQQWKKCFGKDFPKNADLKLLRERMTHDLKWSMYKNRPYVVLTIWFWDTSLTPPRANIMIRDSRFRYETGFTVIGEGTCPPYLQLKYPSDCRNKYFPNTRLGLTTDTEFQNLVASRDFLVTAETHFWHHPITPVGNTFFNLGENDFIYHVAIF